MLLIFQKPHSEEKVKDSDEEIKTESGDDINEINSEQMVSIDGENNNRKDNRPVNYSGTEEGKN